MHFNMPVVGWVVLVGVGLVLLRAAGVSLGRPAAWALRLAIGGSVIWAIDLLVANMGIHVGINPISAGLVGFLGFPGLLAVGAFYYLAHGGIIP